MKPPRCLLLCASGHWLGRGAQRTKAPCGRSPALHDVGDPKGTAFGQTRKVSLCAAGPGVFVLGWARSRGRAAKSRTVPAGSREDPHAAPKLVGETRARAPRPQQSRREGGGQTRVSVGDDTEGPEPSRGPGGSGKWGSRPRGPDSGPSPGETERSRDSPSRPRLARQVHVQTRTYVCRAAGRWKQPRIQRQANG